MPEMVVAKRARGRPPGKVNQLTKDIQSWALDHADTAKRELLKLCKSKNERIRLDAISAILVRAYGAPKQAIGLDGATLAVFAGIKIVIGGEKNDA